MEDRTGRSWRWKSRVPDVSRYRPATTVRRGLYLGRMTRPRSQISLFYDLFSCTVSATVSFPLRVVPSRGPFGPLRFDSGFTINPPAVLPSSSQGPF